MPFTDSARFPWAGEKDVPYQCLRSSEAESLAVHSSNEDALSMDRGGEGFGDLESFGVRTELSAGGSGHGCRLKRYSRKLAFYKRI